MKSTLTVALGLVLALTTSVTAQADPSYNNDLGQYTDPLTTSNGFVTLGASAADPTFGVLFSASGGGTLSLPVGGTAGHATTLDIIPGPKSAWGDVFLNYTGQASTIQVTFIDTDNCNIETSLGSPVAAGVSGWNGKVSLAGVSDALTRGRLRFNFTSGTVNPTLLDFQMTWVPQSELRVALSSPTTTASGSAYAYTVQFAVNNVTATAPVVYVPRPTAPTDPFGQPNTLSFVSATDGGQYTTTPLSLGGHTIPANSVYWVLADTVKGTTRRLNFTMRPPNGTLAGTAYGDSLVPTAPRPSMPSPTTHPTRPPTAT